jgi:hypothetical protein
METATMASSSSAPAAMAARSTRPQSESGCKLSPTQKLFGSRRPGTACFQNRTAY